MYERILLGKNRTRTWDPFIDFDRSHGSLKTIFTSWYQVYGTAWYNWYQEITIHTLLNLSYIGFAM